MTRFQRWWTRTFSEGARGSLHKMKELFRDAFDAGFEEGLKMTSEINNTMEANRLMHDPFSGLTTDEKGNIVDGPR